MGKLTKSIDKWGGLLLLAPVGVLVAADIYSVTLSTVTYWAMGIWFVAVSGVNLATWARHAGQLASAVSKVQKALSAADEEDKDKENDSTSG